MLARTPFSTFTASRHAPVPYMRSGLASSPLPVGSAHVRIGLHRRRRRHFRLSQLTQRHISAIDRLITDHLTTVISFLLSTAAAGVKEPDCEFVYV